MNRNVLKMFGRKQPKQNINIEHHLWTQLEVLSRNDSSPLEITFQPTNSEITIQFAAVGERARKVVRRSNYRMTGKFPSIKNGRMIHWESHYEKMAFQLLEIAPFVVSYREQPAIFKFINLEGTSQKHFPDLMVELINGRKLFVEVKSDRAKGDQNLMERTSLLQDLIQQNGYRYLMVYPDQIESFYYLENAEQMLWYAKTSVPFPVQYQVKQYLSHEVEVTFNLLKQVLNHLMAKAWIYRMLIEGLITSDLSLQLTDLSIITNKNR